MALNTINQTKPNLAQKIFVRCRCFYLFKLEFLKQSAWVIVVYTLSELFFSSMLARKMNCFMRWWLCLFYTIRPTCWVGFLFIVLTNIDRYVTILWHIILTVSQEVIGFTISTALEGKHSNHYTMEMVLLKQEKNNGCIIHN